MTSTTRKLFLSIFLFVLPAICLADVPRLTVTATNPLPFGRLNQTITLSGNQLKPLGDVSLKKIHVRDAAGRELLCQAVDSDGDYQPDEVIFQADFGPNQTRRFYVYVGKKHMYSPEQFKVYGRFVRERFDDFAWENDRIAQRVYGKALETWQGGPLTSSAIDVWVKSTPELVVNDRYMADHYHADTGRGGDIYSSGTSRGVGGSGLWSDGKLWTSGNFVDSHMFTNGPIRVMFQLSYDTFNVNGHNVSLTKRITLDASQNLNHFEVTYQSDGLGNLVTGIGIEKTNKTPQEVRKGMNPGPGPEFAERPPGAFTQKDINVKHGWITTQQPLSEGKLYVAVIVNPDNFVKVTENEQNELVLTKVPDNNVLSYWAGYAWSKSGQFKDYQAWKTYISHFAQGLRSPIQTKVSVDGQGEN